MKKTVDSLGNTVVERVQYRLKGKKMFNGLNLASWVLPAFSFGLFLAMWFLHYGWLRFTD